MTNTSGTGTPAGWYPDPAGSGHLRWWDGSVWTAHLAPQPTPAPAPTPTVQAPTPAPVFEPAATTPAGEPYVPFQGSWNQSAQQAGWNGSAPGEFARPAQWNTAGAWLLAFSGVVAFAAVFIAVLIQGPLAPSTETAPVYAVIQIGFVLLNLLFAAMDRRKLKSLGYLHTPSLWWILLLSPLIYLIMRGVVVSRETGHGYAPLITFIATYGGLFVLAIVASVAIPAFLAAHDGVGSTAYATQFTTGLERGLDENGGNYSVACPPTIPTAIGATFSCTATDTATNTAHTLNIQVTQGSNGQPGAKLLSVDPPITH